MRIPNAPTVVREHSEDEETSSPQTRDETPLKRRDLGNQRPSDSGLPRRAPGRNKFTLMRKNFIRYLNAQKRGEAEANIAASASVIPSL